MTTDIPISTGTDDIDIPIAWGQQVRDVEGDIVRIYRPDVQRGHKPVAFIMMNTVYHHALSPQQDGMQFEVQVRYTPGMNSPFWIEFAKSMDNILGPGHRIPELQGKRVRFVWANDIQSARLNRETGEWDDVMAEGWKVYSIDGKTNPKVKLPGEVASTNSTNSTTPDQEGSEARSLEDMFLEDCVDGKAVADMLRAVQVHPQLKNSEYADVALDQNEGVVSPFIASGRVTQDASGILHLN